MTVGEEDRKASAAIIVMGVSGCGKSSIGKELASCLGIGFIEGDSLHPPENVAKMASGTPLTDQDRWPWLDAIGSGMAALLAEGRDIVISCSALRKAYRDRLRAAAGDRLYFLFLKGSPELLAERMEARTGHFMPLSLLESQLATFEDPGDEAGVITISIDAHREEIVEIACSAFRQVLGQA